MDGWTLTIDGWFARPVREEDVPLMAISPHILIEHGMVFADSSAACRHLDAGKPVAEFKPGRGATGAP